MTPDELAVVLLQITPDMERLLAARLRPHGLESDAEDLVGDARLALLESQTPILPETVTGLFHDACGRLAYNHIRDLTRRASRLSDDYTRIYQPDSQALMHQREILKADVEAALGKLDPQTSRIVRLVWMEDETHLHVKRALKIAGETVSAALETALPILQHELAHYDHRQRKPSVPAEDRCLTSQPAYKKEADETDTAMPSGGNGAEIVLTETDRRFADHPEGLWIPDEELAWLMAE